MQYHSCSLIENFNLNFNGRVDTDQKIVALCCENIEDPPAIALQETGKDTIENFRKMRNYTISESAISKKKRKHSRGCVSCAYYQLGNWKNDDLVHYVNLSMYPAPCQSQCIYCSIYKNDGDAFRSDTVVDGYKKVFDALSYAQISGLISPTAVWQVSSGEITIHPYKEKIFDVIKNQSTAFYTNCFLYDEKIGANLADNPQSFINLSIDSGTPKTWYKVKGFDNFDHVTNNLVRYYTNSVRDGQITLKYIILPGINDNYEDFLSVIEIMNVLHIRHLTLSRDVRYKYSLDEEQSEKLIGAAAYFVALLVKNEKTFDLSTYTPAERELAIAFANVLLKRKEV